MKLNYTIIFVSDMKKSVFFYKDILGIPLKFESPEWSEFATDGAILALHHKISTNPDLMQPEHSDRCRPGFQVPNLEEFHKRMVEKNVPCSEKPKEIFGSKVAQYIDPDGLIFSVGETG